jgi:hypothetical protein
MDIAVGWNGALRSGYYAPLIVSIENPGKKLQCTVSIDLRAGSELRGTVFTSAYSQELALPARSGKRLFFTLPFSNATLPLIARVESGGAELLRREVDVSPMMVDERLIVGISSELSLDFLSELIEGVRVVYPHTENLPDGWSGYDAVDIVVVHDTAFQNLRAAQVSALERWVFSGGVLVVSGGPPALQLLTSGLQRLLPVEIEDLVPRNAIRSLDDAVGEGSVLAGEMIIARSRPLSGTVLAEEDGIPILAERRLGSGFVRFIAFDCTQKPAVSWRGNAALWKALAAGSGRPAAAPAGSEPVDEPWLKGILGAPDLSFPSGMTLLMTLTGYFLAVLAATIRRKKGGISAATRAVLLLCLTVTATLSAWIFFRGILFHGSFMVEASVAEAVSGDGLAKVTGKVGLFSAGGGDFGLSTPEKAVTAADVVPLHRGSTARRMLIETANGTEFKSIHLGRFGSRLLTLGTVMEMKVSADISDSGLLVINGSPYALEGCFLRYKSALYPIGDVPSGKSVRRTFSLSGGVEGEADAVPDARRLAFFREVRDGFDRETTLLFGWLDSSPLSLANLSGDVSFAGRSVNLLVVEAK